MNQTLRRSGLARLGAIGVVVAMAALAAWSFAAKGLVCAALSGDLSAAEKIKRLQDFFGSLGAAMRQIASEMAS